jgi:hypothetical protein
LARILRGRLVAGVRFVAGMWLHALVEAHREQLVADLGVLSRVQARPPRLFAGEQLVVFGAVVDALVTDALEVALVASLGIFAGIEAVEQHRLALVARSGFGRDLATVVAACFEQLQACLGLEAFFEASVDFGARTFGGIAHAVIGRNFATIAFAVFTVSRVALAIVAVDVPLLLVADPGNVDVDVTADGEQHGQPGHAEGSKYSVVWFGHHLVVSPVR